MPPPSVASAPFCVSPSTPVNTASCAARGRERTAVLGLRHTAHEEMKVRGVVYAGNVTRHCAGLYFREGKGERGMCRSGRRWFPESR